ncbi:hypothetical protein BGZ60DRAFT_504610 [Tricladium varicosporioides]|nr:hypothetical protein BGZ60DRAFT_504610 [Hymenoscyphus varicosporioides]
MAPGQPPPPPPPPGQRGPPPQGMPGAGPPGQHPGPANRPPMQGPPPFLSQMRQPVNSTRVVDISPRPMRDAASCRKELTTYQVYTIKKAIPNGREKPTWARSEVVQEKIPKSEIVKDIKKLNEGRNSVADKKASLAPFMQGQIVNLIDDLSTREHDANFEWSLVQLDTKRRHTKKYHMEGRSPSPPRRITVVQGPEPVPVQAPRPYAPEVPRAPPQQPQMPSFETVDAAYHAGKIDADLERRGQEERERFQAPPQAPQHPIIIERQIPVVIEQPREPRAIISYGRAERERDRLPDSPTRSWAETRYSEPLISPYATHRYIEDLRDTRPPMRVQREYRAETRGFRPEFRDIGYDRDEFHDREFSPEPQRFRPEPREFRPEPRGYQPDFRETRRGSDFFDHEDEEEFIPQPRPFMERRATEPRARMSYYPREPEPHPFAPLPRSYPLPVRPGPSPGW